MEKLRALASNMRNAILFLAFFLVSVLIALGLLAGATLMKLVRALNSRRKPGA